MYELLQKIPLFASVRKKELEQIAAKLVEYRCPKDGLILMESDTGSSLFLLVRGRVKISRTSGDGGEVILAILKEGDVFGEMSLLDGEARSANVTAIEDTEMLVLRREDFLALIERFPQIAIGLLKDLASRLRKSDSQIKSLSLLNAKGRVASTLLQLSDKAPQIAPEAVEIGELPTQQDLANMAGTSRETISRCLKVFADSGYIERKQRHVIIMDRKKFSERYI